jgi:triacylglycerol lipase
MNKAFYVFLARICQMSYKDIMDDEFLMEIKKYNIDMSSVKFIENTNSHGISLEHNNKLIICWCGTNDEEDIEDDINILQKSLVINSVSCGKVHSGFYQYYKDLEKDTDEVIQEYLEKQHGKDTEIIFTGHSLGSCICMHALKVAVSLPFVPMSVITFGSPMMGNREFVKVYSKFVKNSTRFYNANDIVVNAPLIGFKHTNDGVCLTKRNCLKEFFRNLPKLNMIKEHMLDAYISSLEAYDFGKKNILERAKTLFSIK